MMNMSRREALSTIALAAVPMAGCVGGRCAGGRGPLFGACRGLDDVPTMKRVGYDFWEWNVAAALAPDKDDAWWRGQLEAIRTAALPLRSCNGFLPGRFRLTGPKADHGPALDYAERALRRADEAGITAIVFGSGGARNVPGDFTLPGAGPDVERGARQYADFCRALAERCADLKVTQVVIEPLRPNESNIVNFVWQGVRICREVGSPRVAQLADIFHMMMGGEEAESIRKAGPLLRHCHIADYGTRQFPGFDPKETDRLRPYFDALRDIGYAGGVSCECGWGEDKNLERNLVKALETMKGLI